MEFKNFKNKAIIALFALIFLLNTTSSLSKESKIMGNVVLSKNQERIDWKWWEKFEDPILTDALKKSVDNNFDVLIAGLKVEEAQNYIDSSQRNRLPEISMGMSYNSVKASTIDHYGRDRTAMESAIDTIFIPLRFSYEYDLWGKKRNERALLDEDKNLVEFEKNLIILSTVTEVSSLYFNILKNGKIIDIYKQIYDLKREKLGVAQEKYNLKLATQSELNDIKKELNLIEEKLNDLKARNEELRNRFNLLIFGDKQKNPVVFKSLDQVELFYDEELEISTANISNRPDILMAEQQIRMAKLDIKIARKAFLPRFVFSGDIYQVSRLFNGFMYDKNIMYRVGDGIFYDLFKKKKNMAELKAKKNKYEQVLKEYEKTIVTSINDVNNSLFYLKNSLKNYERAQENSRLDRESLDIEKERLDSKLITLDEYIDAKEKFLRSQIKEYSSKTECLIHTISLYKALGGNA